MKFGPGMRRNAILNLLFFFAISVLGSYFLHQSLSNFNLKSNNLGEVIEARGSVQIRGSRFDSWKLAYQNSELQERSTIYAPEKSSAVIDVQGVKISIDEKTLVQVMAPKKGSELNLDFGNLFIEKKTEAPLQLNFGNRNIQITSSQGSFKISRNLEENIKIEAIEGDIKFIGNDGTEVIVQKGEVAQIDNENDQTRFVASETKTMLYAEPIFLSSGLFENRPALKITTEPLPSNTEVKIGTDWKKIENNIFIPEYPGTYEVRLEDNESLDPLPEGQAQSAYQWIVEARHFQLKSGLVQLKSEVDPTKDEKTFDLKLKIDSPHLAACDLEQKPIFEIHQNVSYSKMVPGKWKVCFSFNNEQYVEVKDSFIEVHSKPPRVELRNDILTWQSSKLREYEIVVHKEDTAISMPADARFLNLKSVCRSECMIRIFYISKSNKTWKSEESIVNYKPHLMSEKTSQIEHVIESAARLNRLLEPFTLDLALGLNYLFFDANSGASAGSIKGVGGPSFYLSGSKSFDSVRARAALQSFENQTQVKSYNQTSSQSTTQRTLWTAVSPNSSTWGLARSLEFGASMQTIPYFSDINAKPTFEQTSALFLGIGFKHIFDLSDTVFLTWEQKLLLPLWSSNRNIKFLGSIDGAAVINKCMNKNWSLGFALSGNLTSFKIDQNEGAQSETFQTNVLNSGPSIRLGYGYCPTQGFSP